jgi:hypothetical protein
MRPTSRIRFSALSCAFAIALLVGASPSAHAGWRQPLTLSEPNGNAVWPDVVVGPHGETAIGWSNGTRSTVVSLRPAGGEFSAPVIVSKAGEYGNEPSLGIDPAGNVLAVFIGGHHDNPPEENGLKAAVLHPDGTVEPALTIATSTGIFAGMGMDGAGNATAWWVPDGENGLRVTYRPAGGRFGPSELIANPAPRLSHPELTVAANGDAVATWGGGKQIYAAISSGGGEFAPARALGVPSQVINARVAMAPDGAAVVAWVDHPEDDGDGFVHASYRPPGGEFGLPQTLAEVFYTGVYDVSVAMSDVGEATVMWAGDTWVPRAGWLNTYVVRPPGGPFGPPREGPKAPCIERPRIAYDSAGNTFAVCRNNWSDDRFLYEPIGVIYAAARARGASAFGTPVQLSGNDENVFPPVLAAGGPGQATAAWPRGWLDYFDLEVATHEGVLGGLLDPPPAETTAGAAGAPGGGSATAADARPLLRRLLARLRQRKRLAHRLLLGPLPLGFHAPAPGRLELRVSLGRRVIALGRASFSAPGQKKLVVRLTRRGRRALSHAHGRPPLVFAGTLRLRGQPPVGLRYPASP